MSADPRLEVKRMLADLAARAAMAHVLARLIVLAAAGEVYAEARRAEQVVGHGLAWDAAKRALDEMYEAELHRLLTP